MPLTLFEALIVTHFVMDWVFQTNWEATKKDKEWLPLFVHSAVYTIGFIPVFFWYGLAFNWLALIFVTHAFLDRRPFEFWWLKTIKRVKREDTPDWLWFMLLVSVDQIFHLLVLAFIVIIG